jgi:hypothetical protein
VSLARRVLLGSNRNGPPRRYRLLVPPLLFVGVFAAYAVGAFEVSGGVVFLAGDAAVVGVLAAAVLAYRRAGLALAWATAYGALLGYNADHYLLGLSGRSLGGRVAAFLGPDGLVFVGVQALALGTLAWIAGAAADRAVEAFRARIGAPPAE